MTGGLDYYWFVAGLMKDYDKNSAEIVKNLKAVSALLFTRGNLVSAVTTECRRPGIILPSDRETGGCPAEYAGCAKGLES